MCTESPASLAIILSFQCEWFMCQPASLLFSSHIHTLLQLNNLRVAELKDFLKSVGKKATGRKSELIDLVKNYFE